MEEKVLVPFLNGNDVKGKPVVFDCNIVANIISRKLIKASTVDDITNVIQDVGKNFIKTKQLFLIYSDKLDLRTSQSVFFVKGYESKKEKQFDFNYIVDIFKKSKIILPKKKYGNNEYLTILNKEEYEKLKVFIDKYNIEICFPLINNNRLLGLILSGKRKSGKGFIQQDINLLSLLFYQIGIVLENILLYKNMQKRIERQTEDLRNKNKRLMILNKKLKKYDKTKSEFVSIVSHQLRTPLTVIKGYVSMMNEGLLGPACNDMKQSFLRIGESSDKLINLVNDLLNISKIESGDILINDKRGNVYNTATHILDEISSNASKKNIKFQVICERGICTNVICDEKNLHEIVLNLVDNAIKYSFPNTVIKLKFAKDKNNIIFSVHDQGIGIDKKDYFKLFKKFSRVQGRSLVADEQGTGLGLFFCKKVIEAYKGSIWVESKGKNKGSIFYVKLRRAG